MTDWIYPREKTLGVITLMIAVLVWFGAIVGSFGIVLIVLVTWVCTNGDGLKPNQVPPACR
jgi:multisubunit Na+/H+ antiporter MnhG subunit